MTLTAQFAKHIRDLHSNDNWTAVNLKNTLAGVSWEEAVRKVDSLNTIAVLVFHMNYYYAAILKVLRGGALDASDKYAFDMPPITSQEDWENLANKAFADAEDIAALIEQMPDSQLNEPFLDGKYGNYFRNVLGLIEHTYYHLGQISLIKKMIRQA